MVLGPPAKSSAIDPAARRIESLKVEYRSGESQAACFLGAFSGLLAPARGICAALNEVSCARAGDESLSLNRNPDIAAGDPCAGQMKRSHPAQDAVRKAKVNLIPIHRAGIAAGVENLTGHSVDDHFHG